jgi:hypothetical protein
MAFKDALAQASAAKDALSQAIDEVEECKG